MTVICCWIKSMIKMYQNACHKNFHTPTWKIHGATSRTYLPKYLYTDESHWDRCPNIQEMSNVIHVICSVLNVTNTNITDNPMLSKEFVQYVIILQTILFIACVLVYNVCNKITCILMITVLLLYMPCIQMNCPISFTIFTSQFYFWFR